MIHFKEIIHGFEFGSAKITRMCSDDKKGWAILCLETPKYKGNKDIQIYITKTGKVRVHSSDGEWIPPKKRDGQPALFAGSGRGGEG